MMRNILCWLVVLGAAAGWAQEIDREANRKTNEDRVMAEYRANRARYAGNEDMLVVPGLVADRRARKIHVRAEATGIDNQGIVEFFLVGENSSHGYEAVAVAFVEPGDVHDALRFIGMTPGRPANPARLRFWPKGERVFVAFRGMHEDVPVLAEELIIDMRTGKTLEAEGFVFTGSMGYEPGEDPDAEVYAADRYDPMSIAANYNEPYSVLDVPRRAPQSKVYERQVVNDARVFVPGELLDVVITPERTNGPPRVVNFRLTVRPATHAASGSTNGVASPGLLFDLAEEENVVYRGAPLRDVLEEFVRRVDRHQDPFVTLAFSEELRLRDIRRVSGVVASIDNASGIRVEPPPEGQLYYKAFLPEESFRERAERMAQPWELRLSRTDGATTGILTHIEESWQRDRVRPDLDVSHHPVPTPSALRAALDRLGPGLSVILVFAAPDMRYGEVLAFIRPVLPSHGTVYIFSDPAAVQDPLLQKESPTDETDAHAGEEPG